MVTRRDKANAIRALAMDAVEKAQSGHPGMPMGMADIAEVLWSDFLQHHPQDPHWYDRDRFIVSNGHGAMLLYALLHLTGYDLTLDDIQQFRQLHSRTPGHPEFGLTPGVETTTGPLGQGLGNGVGMALAEKRLAAEFNREGFPIVDHYTYVFAGDGDMMEGVSHEVSSLAGTLGLGKLIVFWDDNHISIDGHVSGWFTENIAQRFQAYGWHTITDIDGHNTQAVYEAIQQARAETERPSLLCCRTVIGYGAPTKSGTKSAHGAPLGQEEIQKARDTLGWSHPPFHIPDAIYQAWDARGRGESLQSQWNTLFTKYKAAYPELAAEFERRMRGELPADWSTHAENSLHQLQQFDQPLATRKSSQQCLNRYGPKLPELSGGSADLTDSNCTRWDQATTFSAKSPEGNYIYYGVREFGMFTIMNGQALHGGLIPYGGTFLTFIDYGRNAIRLAALMEQQIIYVLTHDSIGLGEDGPTHQPIEHAAILRATPNVTVWRPADHVETAIAWQKAIENQQGPTCLLLTRQKVPQLTRNADQYKQIERGGYILIEPEGELDAILIATGSETSLAVQAANQLNSEDHQVRVVAMPCVERFEQQPQDYKDTVMPPKIEARVVIEAGVPDCWYHYAGPKGEIIGIDRYGESAPYQDAFQALGLTVENIIEKTYAVIKRANKETTL